MKNVYILGPKVPKSSHVGLWQIHPFTLFKKEFYQAGYNIIRKHAMTVKDIAGAAESISDPHIIIIRPEWTELPADVVQLCISLRDKYLDSKIILLDPFDQTSSRFFESLPFLDALIKYQCLKDKELYLNDYLGGVYAVQKLKDDFGVSPSDDWSVKSKVEKGQQNKIVSGSFAIEPSLIKKIMSPLNNFLLGFTKKDIDLFCHMSCGKRDDLEWYGQHRVKAIDEMKKLTNFNISVEAKYAGDKHLTIKEYSKAQNASKILYSPLGWGEVTMRAFEAMATQCLLIQPDVSHLDVFPNIFLPFETYIPVKWDMSDLKDKCEEYMSNELKRVEVVNNARQSFLEQFTAHNFISRMEAIFAM